MKINFHDLSYLLSGSQRQRNAHEAIQDSKVFAILHDYSPFLAGTIPLGVDVENSDLDIVCEVPSIEDFAHYLIPILRVHEPLQLLFTVGDSVPMLLVNFKYQGFEFQIIGKPLPVQFQSPYRHLLIEARLLALAGEQARSDIRELRVATGLKTEPAFARYFGLAGDPYHSLLNLEHVSDVELSTIALKRNPVR